VQFLSLFWETDFCAFIVAEDIISLKSGLMRQRSLHKTMRISVAIVRS
jgi:hypothetical protein